MVTLFKIFTKILFGFLICFILQKKKIKDKNLDKGVAKAIDEELQKQGKDFYQVVKKCTPNHKSAMRKLGKNQKILLKLLKLKLKIARIRKNLLKVIQ